MDGKSVPEQQDDFTGQCYMFHGERANELGPTEFSDRFSSKYFQPTDPI